MKHWNLGARLTVWSAIFFATAVALLGVFTISLVRKHQMDGLDAELSNEMRSAFHELYEHGPIGAAHVFIVIEKETRAVVVGAEGKILWASPELKGEEFAQAVPGTQTLGPWRVFSVSENGYTIRVARGFQEMEATVADVRGAYLRALPLLLLLVGGGAWWVVRSALRPVQEISASAERITSARLDARLPLPARRDELGHLTGVLNRMLDRLERGHTQAVRFTADASHELKTPLALMAAGLEELLRRHDHAPEVVESLASLLEDNRRLSAVCQDLLVLARADAGRLALDRQPHDLRALTEAAMGDARILGEDRALTFEVALPAHAEEFVDARYFTRILLNLLSNAVKYNRDGGSVRVRLAAEKSEWIFTIENNGPGLAPEHREKLFARFFRADNSAAAPGHGLGLSLSRELARAHDGDLVFASSDAEWTTFRLTLPRTVFEPEFFPASNREKAAPHLSASSRLLTE